MDGYIKVQLLPDDFFYPMVQKDGYVFEHRLTMAKALKRCLLEWEVVHHKNGNRDDNRLENLEVLPVAFKHNAVTLMIKYIHKLELENSSLKSQLAKLSKE